jgi:hypothetical protein
MNWIGLIANPLWRELWDSPEIKARRAYLEHQLLRGSETDPHSIGVLRGQLAGMDSLKGLVESFAKKQQQEELGLLTQPETAAPEKRTFRDNLRRLAGRA